tara:strand:+ start:1002 stop:1208 length:207 start_codon:yes stop_codon:yes gene_type:complete
MAEVVAIKRMFPKKYMFFVDIGCFHTTKYNNTYVYYKKGYRGINIDIDRIKSNDLIGSGGVISILPKE